MTIKDAGDAAMLLELEPVIDSRVNARAVAIAAFVKSRHIAGVRDVVPTFRSIAVHFDPLLTDVDAVRGALVDGSDAPMADAAGKLVEVPVAYGGEHGPDLADVSTFAGVSAQAVIDRHAATEYRVFMLGFMPGFAYMGTVDDSIAAPRRSTPRMRVPAGSVGIAGRQTGVYPRVSPGGWQLIGRTTLPVFDADNESPSLFAAGDRVRFVPVRDLGSGVRDPKRARADELRSSGSSSPDPQFRHITIVKPGLLTTVQDLGRWGHQDRGVPVGGPMDVLSHRLANALVGNDASVAALEVTLLGPEIRFDDATTVAIAGADLSASLDGAPLPLNAPHRCAAGSTLRFGERRAGTRAYVALDGGIDVPATLGSRATHVISGLGGIDGRSLRAGDRLAVGASRVAQSKASRSKPSWLARHVSAGARLRVLPGPQHDHFDERALDELQRARFAISPQSDRMGYRLSGGSWRPGPLGPGGSGSGDMISDATFIGGIQIPPSGDPILLMADRQTSGGYPQIATVITADLPKAGQLAPGDWIEFAVCSRADAIAALREQEEALCGV